MSWADCSMWAMVSFFWHVLSHFEQLLYALDIFLNGRLHGKWHYVLVNWVEFICLYRSPLMRSFGHFFTTLHSIEMVIQYSRDFQSKNTIFYDIMKQNISWFHISTCIKEFVIGKMFKRHFHFFKDNPLFMHTFTPCSFYNTWPPGLSNTKKWIYYMCYYVLSNIPSLCEMHVFIKLCIIQLWPSYIHSKPLNS